MSAKPVIIIPDVPPAHTMDFGGAPRLRGVLLDSFCRGSPAAERAGIARPIASWSVLCRQAAVLRNVLLKRRGNGFGKRLLLRRAMH